MRARVVRAGESPRRPREPSQADGQLADTVSSRRAREYGAALQDRASRHVGRP